MLDNVDIDSVTRVVDALLDKVRNDSSFSDVRNNVGSDNEFVNMIIIFTMIIISYRYHGDFV